MPQEFNTPQRHSVPFASIANSGLPTEPTPEFWLKFHPDRWGLIDGDFLPVLGTLKLIPGLNGVSVNAAGRLDASKAALNLQINRWKLIERGEKDTEDYLTFYQGRSGAVHCTAWQTPMVRGNSVEWKTDEKAYANYLRSLIEKEVVPRIDEYTVDRLISDQERIVGELSGKPGLDRNPILQKRLKTAESILEQMKVARDKRPWEAPTNKGKR